MKVLIYPHTMEIGGCQLNAVETAGALRKRGHDVSVISQPGPLVELVHQLGVEHIPLDPKTGRRPSPRAANQLIQLVQERGFDIVHGYEWPPGLEAFAGPGLRLGHPVVCTVYSMAVAPFLPHTMPLIVSTDNIRRRAEAAGYENVTLLEPPVDVHANSPGYDPGSFRQDAGLDPGVPLFATVTRIAPELKLEGLLAACAAVGEVAASGIPLQLVIVGDGAARDQVDQAAAAANARAGRKVVVLTGAMQDPRPAYAAADVVLGMGSSAERALAFAKPVIVQGEYGFWKLFTADSLPIFLRQGFYGIGDEAGGSAAGARHLKQILLALLDERATWPALGEFGRTVAVDRFSLEHNATVHEKLYQEIRESPRPAAGRLGRDVVRGSMSLATYKVHRKYQRWRGTAPVDDFNSVTTIIHQEARGAADTAR